MKIVLQNVFADKVEFEVNTDNIRFARYNIISGDEVLKVYYLDGSSQIFDSDKHGRHLHYDDCEVMLYSVDELKLINKLPILKDEKYRTITDDRCNQLEELLKKHREGGAK